MTAGGPVAKALNRYDLQLAPFSYLPVLPTANLCLVLPVLHMCAHRYSLVFFALPKLLLLFRKTNNLSSSHCPFQIQYLSASTKMAQAMFLKPGEARQYIDIFKFKECFCLESSNAMTPLRVDLERSLPQENSHNTLQLLSNFSNVNVKATTTT